MGIIIIIVVVIVMLSDFLNVDVVTHYIKIVNIFYAIACH